MCNTVISVFMDKMASTFRNLFKELYVCLQPRTPLEVEIAGLLKNSEAATVTPEGLTVAEQKALEKMNLEEVCYFESNSFTECYRNTHICISG